MMEVLYVCPAVKSELGTSTPRLNPSWTTCVELCADWNWTSQRLGPVVLQNTFQKCGSTLKKHNTGGEKLIILAPSEEKCSLVSVNLNIKIHVRLLDNKGA